MRPRSAVDDAVDFLAWEREIDAELSYEPRPRLWWNRWEGVGIITSWILGPAPLIFLLLG